MRPIRVAVTGVGVSAPIPLDTNQSPFAVGLGCVLDGSATYSVQHTYDDITSPSFNPASATWFTNSGISAATTSVDSNYAFPVQAIRLNVTAGTGRVAMTVNQGRR